jgi:uncharacterized protein YndB with AHSA1/START domain
MFTIEVTREIRRPRHEVYQYVADLERDTQWWTGVLAVRRLGPDLYEQVNRLAGLTFTIRVIIIAAVPPQRLTYRSAPGTPVPFQATYLLSETPSGTGLTFRAEVTASGVAFRLLGPAFRWHLRRVTQRNFDRLSRLLEAEQTLLPEADRPRGERGSRFTR